VKVVVRTSPSGRM